MSTGNFYKEESSSYFAITPEDEFDYELSIENAQYEFEQKFKSEFSSVNDWDNNRNYSGRIFGEISRDFGYYDGDIYITAKIILRSGYYSGCNFDYEIDFEADVSDNLYIKAETRIEKEVEKLKKQIENIFKRISTEYCISARFSNGETIYSIAN